MKRTRNGVQAVAIMLFLFLAVEGAFAAGGRKAVTTAPPVALTMANASFEGLDQGPDQPFAVADNVPGWNLLPDSVVWVWNNSGIVNSADVDGSKILEIITGGVSQVLDTTIQPATDYMFSVRALRRQDLPKLYPIEIQFVSNGNILAACASHTNPDQSAVDPDMEIVALTYRSGENSSAIGGPLEVRIVPGLPLPDGHFFGSSYADNAQVTMGASAAPGAAPGSACSILQ